MDRSAAEALSRSVAGEGELGSPPKTDTGEGGRSYGGSHVVSCDMSGKPDEESV